MDSTQILRDERGHKFMKVQLASTIIDWANFNKNCLSNITNLTIGDLEKLQKLYNEWYEIWILDNMVYGENILETKTSISMHIFVELCRTHFILSYEKIMKEREEIKNLGTIPEDTQKFDILFDPNNNKQPVMAYPQSKIRDSLLNASFAMKTNQIQLEEFKRFIQILYLRNSSLLCDVSSINSLDLDEMREIDGEYYRPSKDYIMFTCIYFQAIFHRLFYLKEFNVESFDFDATPIQQWIENDVYKAVMIGDAFGKYYEDACLEAYNFPGDDAWFRYRYPNEPPYRGTVINCIRPGLTKRFNSEYRISFESVCATIHHFDLQGACSRNFLIRALDNYMWSKFQFHWMDAVCIEHEILESSQGKLFGSHSPYLLEIFSLYNLYYKGIVYQSENIFKIIGLWLEIVKRDYNNYIFGCQLTFD